MTREELTARLAECEGFTPGPWKAQRFCVWHGEQYVAGVTTGGNLNHEADARLIALAPALASALREAWAEIDRLKKVPRHEDGFDLDYPLDAALNENDGVYKP